MGYCEFIDRIIELPLVRFSFKKKNIVLCLCHHKKERCFSIFGIQFPLCSRCTGIFAGGFIGFVLSNFNLVFSQTYFSLLLVPLLIDGFSQLFGLRQSNNKLRFMTGLLFGLGFTIVLRGLLNG